MAEATNYDDFRTFIPVDSRPLELSPVDRHDEVRSVPVPLTDGPTIQIVVTPAVRENIRHLYWQTCGPLAVSLGLIHPFDLWEALTGVPVTAATFPA